MIDDGPRITSGVDVDLHRQTRILPHLLQLGRVDRRLTRQVQIARQLRNAAAARELAHERPQFAKRRRLQHT